MEPNQQRTSSPADGVHLTRPQPAPDKPAAVKPDGTASAPVAAQQPASSNGELVLPLNVVTRSDVSRSLRELEQLDDYFHQAAVRGSKVQDLPTLGRALNSLATNNSLNLIHTEDRERLKVFLTRLKAKAPVIHMSFPSEASDAFLAKILEWFRTEAHPYTVLHIGLQPELAAGCIVRTTNKQFDFSFRKRFEQSKQKLVEALESARQAADSHPVADANATVEEGARL